MDVQSAVLQALNVARDSGLQFAARMTAAVPPLTARAVQRGQSTLLQASGSAERTMSRASVFVG
jgi:hypothetical protein